MFSGDLTARLGALRIVAGFLAAALAAELGVLHFRELAPTGSLSLLGGPPAIRLLGIEIGAGAATALFAGLSLGTLCVITGLASRAACVVTALALGVWIEPVAHEFRAALWVVPVCLLVLALTPCDDALSVQSVLRRIRHVASGGEPRRRPSGAQVGARPFIAVLCLALAATGQQLFLAVREPSRWLAVHQLLPAMLWLAAAAPLERLPGRVLDGLRRRDGRSITAAAVCLLLTSGFVAFVFVALFEERLGLSAGAVLCLAWPFLPLPLIALDWIVLGLRPAMRLWVLYDHGCSLCRKALAVLLSLDWSQRIIPLDVRDWDEVQRHFPRLDRERCLKDMHAVDPAGGVTMGYESYQRIARRLPLTLPFAWVLDLPPVARAGRRRYRYIADMRLMRECGEEYRPADRSSGS